ncbi:hypothetical protein CVT24_012952 [Panaeolus cyanescens]|uniref:Uncharacterized protein n=1 Tax=Panaeolus cyanescens TaxID=181874 RepID=A0A409W6A9_9AGAR|nr:hypothetical protein CVT24_012952 [Panaeolus cyanescens]
MKVFAAVAHVALCLNLVLPVTAYFRLNVGNEVKHPPFDYEALTEELMMVQNGSLDVKALMIDPEVDNAPIDDVGYTSEAGPKAPILPALSFNRENKTISFYPEFFDPKRPPAHRAGLVIAAAYKIFCGAQDTFMKVDSPFGRWQPVARHRIFGRDKAEYIDTVTSDGFQVLGRKAYYATIYDAEAWKWLGLEFRGVMRDSFQLVLLEKLDSSNATIPSQ